MAELKRTLNLTEVIFFATGVILGAGIYTVIGQAAGFGGNMLWLSFLIAAFTAAMSLLAYAELSALYPKSGGEFSYVKEAIGPNWAYVIGIIVALGGIISAATISIGFAGYLSQLIKFPELVAALLIIVAILVINILGIRQSSIVNIIFTVLETGGLAYVIYAAAPSIGDINYVELPPTNIHGILAGAAICFFAFSGFEDTVKLAEETKQPEKTIPRALLISGIIVFCLYITLAIVVVSMIPFGELATSDKPLALVVEKRFGHTGALIIAAVALFSTSNSLLSNMLGASRVIYNMGMETQKLKWLAWVMPKRKTPVIALVLVAVLSCLFSLIGDVKSVALITNFFVFVTFLLINCTLIYLRVKKKDLQRPFKIPLNIKNVPVFSVVAILALLVLIAYTIYGLTT